jgi:threonine dehydratase
MTLTATEANYSPLFDYSHLARHTELPSEVRIARLALGLQPVLHSIGMKLEWSDVSRHQGALLADASAGATGAYKERGAAAAVLEARTRGVSGVFTASAGNHGAGVACAAHRFGLQAIIYVPETAPRAKVDRIRGFGAEIRKIGKNFDECYEYARADNGLSSGMEFIHPFDNEVVAAGQGTIGVEIVDHLRRTAGIESSDAVRVYLPIGGGLVAGVASALRFLWPKHFPPLQILGVVDEGSPAALLAGLFGRPIPSTSYTIADGTKVALVGNVFVRSAHLVDAIMMVPGHELKRTIVEHHRQTGIALEASGALAVTGDRLTREYRITPPGQSILSAPVISGRNIDTSTFAQYSLDVSQERHPSVHRHGFEVLLPEAPGALLHFLRAVREYDITGLTYKRRPADPTVHLRVHFSVPQESLNALQAKLEASFPGSRMMTPGDDMVHSLGDAVPDHCREVAIELDDRPGSFLQYLESELRSDSDAHDIGSLFYRRPPELHARPQVVMGLDFHRNVTFPLPLL